MTKDRSPRSPEQESDRVARLLVEPFLQVIDSAWPETRMPDRLRARYSVRRQMIYDLLLGNVLDSFVSKLLLKGDYPLYRSIAGYRRSHSPHEHGSLTDRELRVVAIKVLSQNLKFDLVRRLIGNYARDAGIGNHIESLEVATSIGYRSGQTNKLAQFMLDEADSILTGSYRELNQYVCDTAQSLITYALVCLNPLAVLSVVVTLCPDNITNQLIGYSSKALTPADKNLWDTTIRAARENRQRLQRDVDAWANFKPDIFHQWVVQLQLVEVLQVVSQFGNLPEPSLSNDIAVFCERYSTLKPFLIQIRQVMTLLSGTFVATRTGLTSETHSSTMVLSEPIKSQIISEIVVFIRSSRNPDLGGQGMFPTPEPKQINDLAWSSWGILATLKRNSKLRLEEESFLTDILQDLWQAHDDSGNGFLRGLPLPNPAIKVARLGVEKNIEYGVDSYYKNLRRIVEVHCPYGLNQCNQPAVNQLTDEVMRRVTRTDKWEMSHEVPNMRLLLKCLFKTAETWPRAPLKSIKPEQYDNVMLKLNALILVLGYFNDNKELLSKIDQEEISQDRGNSRTYSGEIGLYLGDLRRCAQRASSANQQAIRAHRGVRGFGT